jgi:hypothetical protein
MRGFPKATQEELERELRITNSTNKDTQLVYTIDQVKKAIKWIMGRRRHRGLEDDSASDSDSASDPESDDSSEEERKHKRKEKLKCRGK